MARHTEEGLSLPAIELWATWVLSKSVINSVLFRFRMRRKDEQLPDQTSSIAVPQSEGGSAILSRLGYPTTKGLHPRSECLGHGLPVRIERAACSILTAL